MVTAPILVVQHASDCPPAWFGTWLSDAGARLDVRHPYAGQPLPLDLTAHGGLLVLGGPMGAYDDDEFPWLAPTKALVRAGASHGIPVLGICLGHQLAAVALGVWSPSTRAGSRPVCSTSAGREARLRIR